MFTQASFFQQTKIDLDADVFIISDYFIPEYTGGAELTTQALIDSCPENLKICQIKSSNLSIDLLQKIHNKFLIFGNWTMIDPQLIPTIIANMQYIILEYDYKYCKYRSPEKHFNIEGTPCDCHNNIQGKIVSAFYYAAKHVFWMSEKQFERYAMLFPFLATDKKKNTILSSVFDQKTLSTIKSLRESSHKNNTWIVLGSNSWVKGFENAKRFVDENNFEHEIVWNVPYDELLKKLASSKGLVYLPNGGDTCPRLSIECKLLNCEMVLNDFVQHKDENWFVGSIDEIEQYLANSPKRFWSIVDGIINYTPSISGYTTTFNCIRQGYPYLPSIKSLLAMFDEVCVVDGGSSDGTWEELLKLQQTNNKLKLQQVHRHWNHPRFALFDGMQKTSARKMCTCDFCWQMDVDEIIDASNKEKIYELCRLFPGGAEVLSLPVIEWWGKNNTVRCDVTPWKWRISKNHPNIVHGVPSMLRRYDENNEMYASQGTDGCDMIYEDSGDVVPNLNFWSHELEMLRMNALKEAQNDSLCKYEQIMNQIYQNIPSVFHYSWYDIERKIKTYRDYWQNHWRSLYNKIIDDTPENNMFFDVCWKDVTDDMIVKRAKELSEQTCGHIFHHKFRGKIDFKPGIKLTSISEPEICKEIK